MAECLYCHVPTGTKHAIDCPQFEPAEDFRADGGTAGADYDQPTCAPEPLPPADGTLCHALDAVCEVRQLDVNGYSLTYPHDTFTKDTPRGFYLAMSWTDVTRSLVRPGMKAKVQIRVVFE